MHKNGIHCIYRILLPAAVCALLIIGLQPFVAKAFAPVRMPPPPPTPPPPTTSTPAASSSAPTGAFIQLQVAFPATWPWEQQHWQTLRTQVQWQDPLGSWHNTAGWYGSLDEIAAGEGEGAVGAQRWWLPKALLGKGPFRWLVYAGDGGELLATSAPFHLPERVGEETVISVTLQP